MPTVQVKGMSCDHCKQSVTEAVSKIAGVASVEVDLQKGQATWADADPAAPVSVAAVRDAINRIGFTAE